jgi:hypothetical protein
MINRRMTLLAAATAAAALAALAGFVAATRAEAPSGVTPTVLARGTFPPFNVRSDPHGTIDGFRAHSIAPMDIIVRRHDYAVGSTTGWHSHPGPIFITVTQGTLTYYERDDPTCSPHEISAGHGFVDDGGGHVVRNLSGAPAQDVSVITAPVGGTFRTDLPAPGPYCNF